MVIKQKYELALPILKRLYQAASNHHHESPHKKSDANVGEKIAGLSMEKLKDK